MPRNKSRVPMVKPWILTIGKVKKNTLTTGIGIRLLKRTGIGTSLLKSLRRRIAQRFKYRSNKTSKQILTASDPKPSYSKLKDDTAVSSAALLGPNDQGIGDDENNGDYCEINCGEKFVTVAKEQEKIGTQVSTGIDQNVPQPLETIDSHCICVYHKRKEYTFVAHNRPPVLFSDASPRFVVLLARIFDFLYPFGPAHVIAYVNKSVCASVKAYYDFHCPRSRRGRYLGHRLLKNRESFLPKKVMEFLPIVDRVRASSTCNSFYDASNALPLEFNQTNSVQTFLASYAFPHTSRIYWRFGKTPALIFNGGDAKDVVKLIQMLEYAEDDSSNGVKDYFARVQSISLCKVNGLSDSNGKYFKTLVQTLFMDHVSSRLRSLELTELELEDLQFRYLAELWRKASFQNLQRLRLTKNAFSSRFVRDWSWSFEHERFKTLRDIDLSNTEMTNQDLQRVIAWLSTTPALRILNLSYNLCAFATLQMLRNQIEARKLENLEELHCVAITEDDTAIGYFLATFQIKPPCCPHLRVLDVSNNPVHTCQAATRREMVFLSDFPLLETCIEIRMLTISSMQLGNDGFRAIATAMLEGAALKMQHLDISNNAIRSSLDIFSRALRANKLPHIRSLAAADNKLGPLEFETLSSALATNCCPRLQHLDLSANFARGEGIARLCVFLRSLSAQNLWSLDLSKNEIPHRGLLRLAEELAQGNCKQLYELNLSRNPELRAIIAFLDLIRSKALPSLTILQLNHALSRSDGRVLVQITLKQRSAQELRKLKQLQVEKKSSEFQLKNDAKAERVQNRCLQQTRRLREVYDHFGSEAEQALVRRKQDNKASQLRIYQEIKRQKQRQAHTKLGLQLNYDIHAA